MSSWLQDIADMVKKEKEKEAIPWGFSQATTSTNGQPGIVFYTAGGIPSQPPKPHVPLIHPDSASMKDPSEWDQDDEESEIIFEFDGWRIDRYKDTPSNEIDWISHYCPSYGWRYNTDVWTLMADGVCGECCEEVPEEVLTVWKLKNFDNLPSIESCKAVLGCEDLACST